ncbi:UDP-N-acetylglucosamine transferase subunit ALG14 isoform X2 [Callorhinus ursinus]|uniref:UDP-N-acetylglucosamine transferase subunit ALG14 n=1 Tax=Callorhinus ursinus TaxID=34884 RepID=A0A3Q7PCX4_CALUR|nr:UDP-N-acetylglucosamine transferase subunit ALG14 homolog isoform X2 [Callorhinus ursinus]
MASVLILAAAGAAVAVLLALRLWVVLHSRVLVPRQSLSLLVVAGSGGHTTEILRLLENLSNAYSPRHYIIADIDEMSAHKINSFELNRADRDPSTMLPEYYIHRIPRSREVQQSWLSTVLTTLYSLWLSFPLTHRVKPDLMPNKWQSRDSSRSSLAGGRSLFPRVSSLCRHTRTHTQEGPALAFILCCHGFLNGCGTRDPFPTK